MLKRLLDILLSSMALVVFLPFSLVIALVLRLTGEGEVFFTQPRVGRGGRLFPVIKFATMRKDSQTTGTGLLTIKEDPRILPVGRFLRKMKLNEVPQLLNILAGQMSIIGPRPQAEPHFRLYSEAVQKQLMTIRPGLSGIGSIVFRNEEEHLSTNPLNAAEAYAHEIAAYKGELELWYVRHRSVGLDILLILLTIWVVMVPRSLAYRRLLRDLPPPPDTGMRL
jgi:lipopolysaccharide/colanic/teichoic acid biosynthesis glycosyltransferase